MAIDGDGRTNIELEEKARKFKLKNFRGVLMRDELTFKPKLNKRGAEAQGACSWIVL